MAVHNNVTRLLDARGIPYTAYELPPEKLGAVETARLLQIKPMLVYKTIVVARVSPGKPILALVPGPTEVDLKALARATREKKVRLLTQREAEKLTGLQSGGISPLALLHRPFQVVLDQAAEALPEILISGGQRGLDIRLPVEDLVELTQALIAPISRSVDADRSG